MTAADNLVDEWVGQNLLTTDPALLAALREAAPQAIEPLSRYGAELGSAETAQLARDANRHGPVLRQLDARGRRIDAVDFHPAWQALLAMYRRQGLVADVFATDTPGRWAQFAAGCYLHGQVEAGSLCPATMTQAAIPVLQKQPELFAPLRDKFFSREHDPLDRPLTEKPSIWVGMGMTEKQGGSDLRRVTTEAVEQADGSYAITGHKWFFSAPTSDAHLVLARTAAGPTCFWLPRYTPDGARNAVRVMRLKDKLGNRSNASSEVEFHGAWARRLGDEGRGIPTLIEMAGYTRLNCVIGSAALLRAGFVQALHNARERFAFGKRLAEQPLMQTVLADLALESEAAMRLMLRLAHGFEHGEPAWQRLLTPATKLWVCKRAIECTGEAMELLGGNGYVEDGVLARLYREAPVNSIWEGSGNVMALDVLRAVAREPDVAMALLDDFEASADAPVRAEAATLRHLLKGDPSALEAQARRIAQGLVLCAQGVLMREQSSTTTADAFVATRFGSDGRLVGTLALPQAARVLDAALAD
ncbi:MULTISPECIES: acyl-CoA dehydrogenase family protein [unclassified Roseateles]|uniref:acyl-CoA dehydrogenase family protein n=1 Tax=unclassified Roseateles TaxID=2626991 RepID=UPI0006F484A1|nr:MULTISPECIES: acyl-CoA dehydrogenase family protein [unclassified Roseateles]KQW51378.1 DNA alkylation response protein [Pelomonas sp. Root405]KRA77610.1 DNA alkylation response protein [Pelomonas sp. Root662]